MPKLYTTETLPLYVHLTAEDQAARGEEFARSTLFAESDLDVYVEVKKRLREAEKSGERTLATLRQAYLTGREQVSVRCRWELQGASAVLVRLDTGEIVDERSLSDEDRQLRLGEGDEPPPELPSGPHIIRDPRRDPATEDEVSWHDPISGQHVVARVINTRGGVHVLLTQGHGVETKTLAPFQWRWLTRGAVIDKRGGVRVNSWADPDGDEDSDDEEEVDAGAPARTATTAPAGTWACDACGWRGPLGGSANPDDPECPDCGAGAIVMRRLDDEATTAPTRVLRPAASDTDADVNDCDDAADGDGTTTATMDGPIPCRPLNGEEQEAFARDFPEYAGRVEDEAATTATAPSSDDDTDAHNDGDGNGATTATADTDGDGDPWPIAVHEEDTGLCWRAALREGEACMEVSSDGSDWRQPLASTRIEILTSLSIKQAGEWPEIARAAMERLDAEKPPKKAGGKKVKKGADVKAAESDLSPGERLEKVGHLVGTMPDVEFAAMAGVTPSMVGVYRRQKGIPAYVEQGERP